MGIAAAAQINRVSLKLYWEIGEMLFLYSMIYPHLFLEFCLDNFLPSVFGLGTNADELNPLAISHTPMDISHKPPGIE
jgi:hypothetical protein